MPDAVLIDIADAVKDVLDGASLSQAFTSTVKERPRANLETLGTLVVTVVPVSKVKRRTTRGSHREATYVVDVGVQKKCDVSDSTVTRPLIYLVDEIGDLFLDAGILTGYTTATCLQTEHLEGASAGFAPEHYEQKRLFTGVVELTFKVV